MATDGKAESLDLAERLGANLLELRVEDVSTLTPSLRRIRLSAEGLAQIGALPGQDVMLSVPTRDGSTVRRRYSIRKIEGEAGILVIDIVVHGDGPGAIWAAGVQPGDAVEGIGPRGKVTVKEEAAWHLFVGDESFTPAIFSMVESLPAQTPAVVVIEVGGAEDELPLDAVACPAGPTWLYRESAPGVASEVLLAHLKGLELPAGRGHAYVGGEFVNVRAVRAVLAELGMEDEQISPKAYWRAGRSNASHGEPPKE
jgi:NADPH-dependent ferric siderophore reductase